MNFLTTYSSMYVRLFNHFFASSNLVSSVGRPSSRHFLIHCSAAARCSGDKLSELTNYAFLTVVVVTVELEFATVVSDLELDATVDFVDDVHLLIQF